MPPEITGSHESIETIAVDALVVGATARNDGSIDLGELVAESLGLALDPYPRKPGAEFTTGAHDEKNPSPSPFAALEPLKSAPKSKGK